jgi:hypothetical protein
MLLPLSVDSSKLDKSKPQPLDVDECRFRPPFCLPLVSSPAPLGPTPLFSCWGMVNTSSNSIFVLLQEFKCFAGEFIFLKLQRKL